MYDSFAELQNVNIGSKHDICAILEPFLVYYSLPSSKQIISGQAYDQSVWIVPLPAFSLTEIFSKIYSGTTKIKNLDANIDSLKVKLTDEDLKEINSEIREEDVAGARQNTSFGPTNWNYADTPRK